MKYCWVHKNFCTITGMWTGTAILQGNLENAGFWLRFSLKIILVNKTATKQNKTWLICHLLYTWMQETFPILQLCHNPDFLEFRMCSSQLYQQWLDCSRSLAPSSLSEPSVPELGTSEMALPLPLFCRWQPWDQLVWWSWPRPSGVWTSPELS